MSHFPSRYSNARRLADHAARIAIDLGDLARACSKYAKEEHDADQAAEVAAVDLLAAATNRALASLTYAAAGLVRDMYERRAAEAREVVIEAIKADHPDASPHALREIAHELKRVLNERPVDD